LDSVLFDYGGVMKYLSTLDDHMELVKKLFFRGKIYESGIFEVTVKVPGGITQGYLEDYLNSYGMATVKYNVKSLWFFECWFPRYQIKYNMI
jgi:hypothetical protein